MRDLGWIPLIGVGVLTVRLGWKLVDAWLSRKFVVFEGDDWED